MSMRVYNRVVWQWENGQLVEKEASFYDYDGPVEKAMINPILNVAAFRFRSDTGAANDAATWMEPQDTNAVIDVSGGNAKFRIRFRVQETAGGDDSAAPYNIVLSRGCYLSSNYTLITTSTSKLRSADSGSSADDTSITSAQLTGGSGSFVNGYYDETGSTPNITLTANNYTEVEYGLEVVAADVVDGEVIHFGLLRSSSPMGTYTRLPSLTVRKSTLAFGSVRSAAAMLGRQANSGAALSFSGKMEVTVGDVVVVGVSMNNSTFSDITSISDDLGNTYTALSAGGSVGGGTTASSGRVFYSRITNAGDALLSATIGSTQWVNAFAACYAGPFQASPLDANPTFASDATSPLTSPSSGTLAQADELVVSFVHTRGVTEITAVDNSFTRIADIETLENDIHTGMAAKVVSATTAQQVSFTVTTDGDAGLYIASFKKLNEGELAPPLFTNTNTFHAPTVTYTPSAGEVIAHWATGQLGGTDVVLSGSQAVEVGDIIYVTFSAQFSPTVTGVSDSQSSSYTGPVFASETNTRHWSYYRRVTAAGTITSVTFGMSVNNGSRVVAATFLRGPFAESPLDVNTFVDDISNPYGPVTSGTLAQAEETILVNVGSIQSVLASRYSFDNGFKLAGSALSEGDANEQVNGTSSALMVWKKVSATTSQSLTATQSTYPSEQNKLAMVSFKLQLNDLFPSLYADADTFYTPTVTPGGVSVSPSLYDDSVDTFYAHTASYTYALTAPLYDDSVDAFFAATVTAGAVDLQPPLYSDDDTVYAHTVALASFTQDLQPSLYADADIFSTHVASYTYALAPNLYSDADTFFNASVTTSYTLVPSLYSDADAFFTASVTSAYTMQPELYADADTFYAHTASYTYALTPELYADADAFFTPVVSVPLLASLYADADTFYGPTASYTYSLTPALYADADTFFTPTVAGGAVSLLPPYYVDDDTYYTHGVTNVGAILPELYADADTFFSASVTSAYTLTPSLYSDADTFFAASVTSAYTLTPALYADADTFFTAVVSEPVLVSLFADGDTFFSATVTAGAVNLSPSLYADADTVYDHAVSAGGELLPSLYSDGDTFYAATASYTYALTASLYLDADTFYSHVASYTYALTASLYSDGDTFFSPTVSSLYNLGAPLVVDDDTFYAHAATYSYTLAPALYADADAFFEPTVVSEGGLFPPLVVDGDTFFDPTVAATYTLTPALFADGDSIYVAAVQPGAWDLTPALVADDDTVYTHLVSRLQSVEPSLFVDDDTLYAPALLYNQELSPSLVANVSVVLTPMRVFIPYGNVVYVLQDNREADILDEDRVAVTLVEDRIVYSTD